jgi:hypothetical protein
MSIWLRVLLLSLSGILASIGFLGGFDVQHFPTNFEGIGLLVIMFWGIPIIIVTIVLIGLEKLLGKYGRYVVTSICAAPGLFLYLTLLQGGGDRYALIMIACCFAWAALWFITAPRALKH